jgi:hypothetical protein
MESDCDLPVMGHKRVKTQRVIDISRGISPQDRDVFTECKNPDYSNFSNLEITNKFNLEKLPDFNTLYGTQHFKLIRKRMFADQHDDKYIAPKALRNPRSVEST